MTTIVDTHTHIYLDDFDADRQEVVKHAIEAGVTRLLLPAVDSSSYDALLKMVSNYPGICFGMAGLHPTSVNTDFERQLAFVEEAISQSSIQIIAVGEIGLDLYWDTTFKAQQIEALRRQIILAQEYNLPVVLHIRSAKNKQQLAGDAQTTADSNIQPSTFNCNDAYELFFEIWNDLQSQYPHLSKNPGVMHCFSGTVEQALRAIELGFYIGVGGVVTYKNAELQQVAAAIPLQRILLETDSPYLAPVPYRGKRNESSYIVEVARKIAEIKHLSLETIAAQTTLNAETLFPRICQYGCNSF